MAPPETYGDTRVPGYSSKAEATSAVSRAPMEMSVMERMQNLEARLADIAHRLENMGDRVHGCGPSDPKTGEDAVPNHLTWQMTSLEQTTNRVNEMLARVEQVI